MTTNKIAATCPSKQFMVMLPRSGCYCKTSFPAERHRESTRIFGIDTHNLRPLLGHEEGFFLSQGRSFVCHRSPVSKAPIKGYCQQRATTRVQIVRHNREYNIGYFSGRKFIFISLSVLPSRLRPLSPPSHPPSFFSLSPLFLFPLNIPSSSLPLLYLSPFFLSAMSIPSPLCLSSRGTFNKKIKKEGKKDVTK